MKKCCESSREKKPLSHRGKSHGHWLEIVYFTVYMTLVLKKISKGRREKVIEIYSFPNAKSFIKENGVNLYSQRTSRFAPFYFYFNTATPLLYEKYNCFCRKMSPHMIENTDFMFKNINII